MLGSVPTTPKSLELYRPVIGEERTEEILRLADRLRGARVLNVNATAFGGGVAEILGTLVPLMNDIGLAADWQVMKGGDEFFNVTKAMHNSLQGMYYDWTPEMREIWLNYNHLNADLFDSPDNVQCVDRGDFRPPFDSDFAILCVHTDCNSFSSETVDQRFE